MLRTLVLGVGAILVAALALVAYVGLQPPAPQQYAAAPPRMVAVIAATHPIRAGSLLQPGDLGTREIAEAKLPPGAHRDTTEARNALVGAMVRRMLGKDEVIASQDVLRPGDRGFLAAVLAPGTRAISVAVDAVSGEAGLIWPGDRIDLLLTQTIEAADQSLAHRVSGETVLADVRVIAVDQQLVQGGQATGLIQGHEPTSRTITLEVTPHDAARVAVAGRLGKLLVVLRAAQPNAAAIPDQHGRSPSSANGPVLVSAGGGPVWGGDVSKALGADSSAPQSEVHLYQGTKQPETYKF